MKLAGSPGVGHMARMQSGGRSRRTVPSGRPYVPGGGCQVVPRDVPCELVEDFTGQGDEAEDEVPLADVVWPARMLEEFAMVWRITRGTW